jgi:superfamily II DNA or RNA helicase
MELGKVLTHKGYSILKSALTPEQIKKLREDLTVCPKLNTKFAGAAAQAEATFKVFRESPSRYYVPRHYGVEMFGPADSSVLQEGRTLSPTAAEFKGTPYPYQVDIVDSFINKGGNGLICVPCGRGKTFMALNIAARLQRRFLVIVDKEFLMNQWRGEMSALMPGLRIGILQGPKQEIDPEQFDCTICMIQTVCGRDDFKESIFQEYGFAIFDECHHLGAQHFSKCLTKIQVKYMLGLSATPTREDGLTKVFFWSLGEPVYWEKKREPDPTVEVKSVMIDSKDATYSMIPTNWRGDVVMGQLLTNVLGCKERTDEIVRWIRRLAEEPARKILVLSERIGHLEEIEGLLKPTGLTMSYYIGGMKEAKREEGAANARILLASYAMASEAMNIKSLNTVILASPRKHVEQSTGRILRIRASERIVCPVIVDIVDKHSMYINQWRKRLAYYKQCAYKLESWKQGAETPSPAKGGRQSVTAAEPLPRDLNTMGCLFDD